MYQITIDRDFIEQNGSDFYFKKEELQNAIDFFLTQRDFIEIRKVDNVKKSNW